MPCSKITEMDLILNIRLKSLSNLQWKAQKEHCHHLEIVRVPGCAIKTLWSALLPNLTHPVISQREGLSKAYIGVAYGHACGSSHNYNTYCGEDTAHCG